ncbi:helix-turn-helix domain-containing protein [Aureimonas frigidaquae]|uniref:helix-turn-helix domain-containing protein n=1 Tax=Aureimonas frigidaquae TaxID=424757 RepID=UPI000785D8DD|nr:helix-turn-helix transcriptional regulator [Aureimonas frigidaquae]
MTDWTNYARNLQSACATRRSISEICREVGINRQQFNRYIHGQTLPSAHNRQRIAQRFGLTAQDFALPQQAFAQALNAPRTERHVGAVLKDGFPGDLAALQPYLGFYQTYHLSMSWPGKVVCSCAVMRAEDDGTVSLKTLERIADADNAIRQLSKYVGTVAWSRNRIFIVERSLGRDVMISQTTLVPFETHQRTYLRGITMGVAWRCENTPYASRMMFRHMGATTDLRALVSRCGVHNPSDRWLPEPVRRFLDPADPKIVSIPGLSG